jgi:hypothetical protein
MLRKVRIKQVPKARTGYQVQGSLANDVPAMGGADYNAYIGAPRTEVSRTLKAVPREVANLEAEGGETVVGDLDGSTMPSFKTIVGPRHSAGGVPLALPDDSFIFSDTRSMKISDPKLLKMFNKSAKKGGYTPAELSKQYDINKYRKILQDPNSDKVSRNTAEIMIKNYVMKLGALALAQESKKGFPQGIPLIAKPYMEANKIAEEDLIPELAQEQPEQQMMPQEGMQPEMEAPQTMPDGQPIAMPQGQPEQMMQPPQEMAPEMMQQAPMAAYGMEMGGFYPEYAFGGYFQKGGNTSSKTKTKEQLEKELREGKAKVEKTKTLPDGTVEITRADGTKVYAKGTTGETVTVPDPKRQKVTKQTTNAAQYKKDICARIKNQGYTAEQAAGAGWISAEQIPNFKGCENLKKSETESSQFFELEEEPSTVPGKKKCKCTDPVTKQEKIFEIEKDEDCICESEEDVTTQQAAIQQPPARNPQFWQQDIISGVGAFGDLMDIRKQMPWEARVDLEEPRPTFLDPTRELAQQSEMAHIASQANAQFAGPQAMGARNAAIQGQGAAQAANTLSQINNQNVGIANQFEANQVGVRNQEQAMNQQMANRIYDKNVIANQQFDNAKRQGRAIQREAYKNALTNKWKTDALNQMYPNYQVDPLSGGRVQYTPTAKTPTPTKPGEDDIEYIRSLEKAGLSKEAISAAVKARFSPKKFGGQTMFADGGYIYTVFPAVTL